MMQCNICSSTSVPHAKARVLDKYDVQYFACEKCGFIQTEIPYWLNEAYADVIAKSDLGLISRNTKFSTICASIIPLYFSNGDYLDYGGGNGMFVRMMRDRGFHFYWHDKFAYNQFATGFGVENEKKYSLVTAFEVFEHLVNPIDEIEQMFRYSKSILFSTRLIPKWNIEPNQWWYFATDTGQHVSFYSKEALEVLAHKFNANLSSNGISLHLLSMKKIPKLFLKAISFPPFSILLASMFGIGRRSLLPNDYYQLTGKYLT